MFFAVAATPLSTRACWDGYLASSDNLKLSGSHHTMSVPLVFEIADWLARYSALLAKAPAGVHVENDGMDSTLVGLPGDDGSYNRDNLLETNRAAFFRIAQRLSVSTGDARTAWNAHAQPIWTVQVLSGADAARVEAARVELGEWREMGEIRDYRALGLLAANVQSANANTGENETAYAASFVNIGGFPASNPDEWVLSEGAQHRLVSGMFLTRANAALRANALRALGVHCNVRMLRHTETRTDTDGGHA